MRQGAIYIGHATLILFKMYGFTGRRQTLINPVPTVLPRQMQEMGMGMSIL